MRKGEMALKVLEALEKAASDAATLIETIASSPYGSSLSRLEARRRYIEKRKSLTNYVLQNQQRLYDTLYRLHRDGLIKKEIADKRKIWHLTLKGKQESKWLRKYFSFSKPPQRVYQKVVEQELKIIAFDIPEKYKLKRWWLRKTLKSLGFTMLQKSVWVGKCKIPQEFIEDIYKFGLLPHLEVLAVTKTGSLKELTR